MKKQILVLGCMALVGAASAQVSYTSGNYNQDFDSLLNTGTANAWTDNATILGWYMRRVNDPDLELADQYDAGTGSSNAGAVYSFGSAGSAERALGSIASGSVEHAVYGVRLRNDSGSTLTSFTLNYTGEQWRNGGNTTQHRLMFSYNIGGSTIGADLQALGGEINYVADPNFTTVSALDFVGPVATATAGLLDGNLAVNQAFVGGSVNVNWGAGQDLWIRWVDLNNAGNDHGLGIDNMSFSAVPEPATIAALGLGAAALLRRRRK